MQSNSGYSFVCLYNKQGRKNFYIHRLVAEAFLSNPNSYCEINHIDENKCNNVIENLEWCTRSYNLTYGNRINNFVKNCQNNKSSKRIVQLDTDNNIIKVWPSINELKRNGFVISNIIACLKGRQLTSKGFKWKYYEAED